MKKLLIGVLMGCMLVSGCGSAAETSAKADYYANDLAPMAAESATAYEEDYAYDASYYDDAEEYAMEESTLTQGVTFASNKKIIYESNVVLETKAYNETYAKLVELINKNGGYIQYENYNNEMRSFLNKKSTQGNTVIATDYMTIRIPSKNYSAFMQEGLNLGNVLNRNQSIQDKTSEYNTNKSYVDILNDEAEYLAKQLNVLETELREAQANDKHYDEIIENMKDIAERKAQVEKELVPYKRVMDDIDEKVEYSTITMELREVDEYTVVEEEPEEEDSFGKKIVDGWKESMSTLSNMLQSTVLFLIAIIPALVYLAIFGAIAFGIYKLVKKIKKTPASAPMNVSAKTEGYKVNIPDVKKTEVKTSEKKKPGIKLPEIKKPEPYTLKPLATMDSDVKKSEANAPKPAEVKKSEANATKPAEPKKPEANGKPAGNKKPVNNYGVKAEDKTPKDNK